MEPPVVATPPPGAETSGGDGPVEDACGPILTREQLQSSAPKAHDAAAVAVADPVAALQSEPVAAVDGATGEPAPEEVERDLGIELNKLDMANQASGWDQSAGGLPATQPQDPLAFDASYGLSVQSDEVQPGDSAPGFARPAPLTAYRTLEDMCSAFPKLATGEQWLYVERKSPAQYHGTPCKGWICNVYEPINTNRFRDKFGGGTFVVKVQGPQLSSIDADGRHKVRTLASLENLVIAGAPRFPDDDEDDSMKHPLHAVPGGRSPEVERTRLQLSYKERARQDERADRMADKLMDAQGKGHTDADMWQQMERVAERRAEDIRAATAEGMGTLRAHNDRLQRQIEERAEELARTRQEKDTEIHKLREEIFKVRQEATQAAQRQETTRIVELKEQHDRELKRVERDHSEKLERMSKDNREAMREIVDRNDRERGQLTLQHDRDRENARNAALNREKQLIDDANRRETNMRADLDARLNEQHRSSEREIRSIKGVLEQQIVSIQTTESAKSDMAQNTANMQVSMLQGQLTRVEAQAESATREAEDYRRGSVKEPLQAIREARELVEMTGGGSKDETDLDWKRGLVQVARNLVDKAPEAVAQFAEVREQNKALQQQQAAQHAHRAAMAAQQQQHAAMQLRDPSMARQQPPRRAHRQPPPGMARMPDQAPVGPAPPDSPPTFMGAAPLGASGAPPEPSPAPLAGGEPHAHVPASPIQPAMPNDGMPMVSPDAPPPMPAPVIPMAHPQPPMGMAAPPAPPPPVAAPPAAPVAPAPPAAAAPAPPTDAPALGADQVVKFIDELEDAIAGGLLSAERFAQGFVEKAGVDTTRAILMRATADQLVDGIAQGGGQASVIVTRDGRKYVRELWVAAGQLVGLAS